LESEVEVDVLFHDADPMGITWHGNYFRYLESARAALLDTIGYNYSEMVESGYRCFASPQVFLDKVRACLVRGTKATAES
jgi:acyl-CoA thioesterase FadM